MTGTAEPAPPATTPTTITCADQHKVQSALWLTVLLAATTDLVHATSHGYRATCTHEHLDQLLAQYGAAPICDVCRAPWPRWTHAARTQAAGTADDGSWLLCDPCDDAKRTGDLQVLRIRMRRANLASAEFRGLPIELMEQAITGTLQTMAQTTTTERRPVPWLAPGTI